MGYIDRS